MLKKKEKYNVAVVGIGMVGGEMVKVLRQKNFPIKELRILATRERIENIAGEDLRVYKTTLEAFEGIDIAIFAGTEGASGASQQFGWDAIEKKGVVVIDNGGDFRMDSRVPLVVPEVNAGHLKNHIGFISNPNCSTIQMVTALAPLHRKAKIKRIVVSTYQSVSGTGRGAVAELEEQIKSYAKGDALKNEIYPHQIAFNILPHISSLKDEFPGYYGEEIKMIKEPRKIFGLPDLAVSATCARVPVFKGHGEAINVQFEKKITADVARDILSQAPGIKVVDNPKNAEYPMPIEAADKDEVFVGRIREDSCNPNTLDLWIVADNIRKGATLNAVQIAECLIK
jgi:aspartate-semialdehyde dehydrogenase